jgi:hypothetical protein
MIGATTRRASAARQSWRRSWPAALVGLGAALAVTACGSAGTIASTPPTANQSPTSTPSAQAAAFPGVVGTAAAVSGSSMQVQNPTSGEVTVTFTTATVITETVAVTSQDVTVGSCVAVIGKPSTSGSATRSVTATTVTISTSSKGNCSATGGFGGFRGPQGTFSPRAGFTSRPRPTGSRGPSGFGGADGKVTSLSASGFVVQGRNRAAGADTSILVTTTAATKYLKMVTARQSALKVGECITAVGQANSIGAVTARSIRISQPGPNGCVTGFGRRGGFGGSPGGSAGNA